MKHILVFARDPGGANVVLPLVSELKKSYEVEVYAKEFALQRMKQELIDCYDIELELQENSQEAVLNFVRVKAPDLIITGTSLDDYTERFLWEAAKILEIPSFAIVDQWMNLGIRFSKYDYTGEEEYFKNKIHDFLPKKILVMDKIAKNELINEGIEENRIFITGQPHFDTVREKYDLSQEEKIDKDIVNIVFVSEPIVYDYDNGQEEKKYWGYNEKTIFEALYQSVIKYVEIEKRKVCLTIRPHPREDAKAWEMVVNSRCSPYIDLVCDTESNSIDLLRKTDLVCGMSSMFLLEAVICEVPVISIQLGLRRESPFILDKIGILKSVLTEEKLYNEIQLVFLGLKRETSFEIIKNATQNVMSYVKEELKNE